MTYAVTNTWPASLPLPRVDYSGSPQYSTIFGGTDYLRVERRSRFKRSFATLGLSWSLDQDQFAAFQAFFVQDLGNGSNQFDLEIRFPKNSELTHWAVCFVGDYSASAGNGVWSVSAAISLITPISL